MFILICGLPNAGKTTYSQQFENTVHVDDIIAKKHSLTQTLIEIVHESDNLCLEGVFPLASRRKMFREVYNGKYTKCIWINTPYEECIRRENRGRAEILIQNCSKIFEPPTFDEGWDEIIIIENEKITHLKKE